MYFYPEKIPCTHGRGWKWGWVARPPGSILSYVISAVDMPAVAASTSTTPKRVYRYYPGIAGGI